MTSPATDKQYDVLVLGSGPGGYAAAFRAADLGKSVVLVEKHSSLGGVCLNVGCIPSKALLHVAGKIHNSETSDHCGVRLTLDHVNINQVRQFKEDTVTKLTGNLALMAKQRGVTVITGTGTLTDPHHLLIQLADGDEKVVQFEKAILATGSTNVRLPFIPYDDKRILDSTSALALKTIPKRLLIMGGGIIGMEMATVYQALGSEVTVAELSQQLMAGADKDLVKVFEQANKERFTVLLDTQVTAIQPLQEHLLVSLKNTSADNSQEEQQPFDAVLVSVGRKPNGHLAGIKEIGVEVDERGFVITNSQCRTNISSIYAIGDLTHGPMLAHKASHQAHIAAEVACGHNVHFQPLAIPSIAYTFPEVAWVGLTEAQAKQSNIAYKTAVFPWQASGRAIATEASQGKTKLIYEPETNKLLGAGLVGEHAGELLGELTLALEYGATLDDIALTIHAHPSLHESVGLAAELGIGSITDFPNPKTKKNK